MGRPYPKLKYDRGLTPHLGRSSIQSRVLDFKCDGQYLVNVWRRSVLADVDFFRGDRHGDRFNIRRSGTGERYAWRRRLNHDWSVV